MEPKLHQIDPDGDTLLILCNPNAPFAAPPAPPAEKEDRQEQPKSDAADESQTSTEEKPEVRMRLSSGHLRLASAYFQKLMAHGWKEATTDGDYSYVVKAENWDEKALLIMMNIVHGKTADLSMTISLEILAKICALVDYYQCHRAVKFFYKVWLRGIDQGAIVSGRDLLLRLSVSCVFSDPATFRWPTMMLIRESTEPIDALGLPIPQTVIDAVNKKRESSIPAIVDSLKGLIRDEYSNGVLECSFDCSSLFIGALSKHMNRLKLSDPDLTPPYVGHSLATLRDEIFEISGPSFRDCPRYRRRQSSCSLVNIIRPVVESQIDQVVGLQLKDYIKVS